MVAASSFRCAYCDRSAYRHVRGDWLCKGHYQDSKGGVTMPKEPKPNFASFTKAELVKTVKKLDARQTKLLNRIAELEGQIAASIAQPATYEPGPYDVVHVTQRRARLALARGLPPAEDWQGVPEATPEDWRHKGEAAAGKPAFPWEKD